MVFLQLCIHRYVARDKIAYDSERYIYINPADRSHSNVITPLQCGYLCGRNQCRRLVDSTATTEMAAPPTADVQASSSPECGSSHHESEKFQNILEAFAHTRFHPHYGEFIQDCAAEFDCFDQ